MRIVGSIDGRWVATILLVALAAVVLAFAMRDLVDPVLAGLQGCPNYISGSNLALNSGCPFDVHPWLLP